MNFLTHFSHCEWNFEFSTFSKFSNQSHPNKLSVLVKLRDWLLRIKTPTTG